MTEMVEKVARALDRSMSWDSLSASQRASARRIAHRVIEAMREPTEAMSEAGHSAVYGCYSLEEGEGFDEHPGNAAWRAMIDAALK